MKINTFLEKVCEEIKYKPVRQAISEELEEHLLEVKEEKVKEEKITEEEAEEKATDQMGEPEKIGKRLNEIHRSKLDWQLLGLVIVLIAYGIVNIVYKSDVNDKDVKDSIFYMLGGIAIGVILYFFDYRKVQKFSNVLYLIATAIIVLAFASQLGVLHSGTQYLAIGGIMFNPAIIAIPLYIISFAGFLFDVKENKGKELTLFKRNISIRINGEIKIIISSILSIILILALPSAINAVILVIVYFITGMVYIWKNSANKKRVIAILSGGMLTIAIFLFTIVSLNNIPVQRILYSLKPEADPQGLGYAGMLQKEVLENSKMIGQANTELITEGENIITKESNYAFIYLMGKLGGGLAIILAMTIILLSLKLILDAKLIKDMYGKIAMIGLGVLYILQSLFNILMNLNLGIQTNVNLPFVCEGGVFFIINCISMAFVLSIYRRKDINIDLYKTHLQKRQKMI